MTTVIFIGKILLCILCLVIVAVVAAQKPADDNPGAALGGQGNTDSYANKMRSRTVEGKLNTMTKVGGVAVGVVSFALVLMQSML